MNGTSQVPPAAPGVPPAKKGTSPLLWIGIGCLALLMIAAVSCGVLYYMGKRALSNPGMTAAKMAVRVNPDLELVDSDDAHNTLTVKNKKTGETVTINADDIKNGKLSFKTDKGTATFDSSSGQGVNIQSTDDKGQKSTMTLGGTAAPKDLPSWVPVYPGGTVQGNLDSTTAEARTAAFTVTTKDDLNKVLDFYESQLKGAGLKTERATYSANGQNGGNVSGKSEDGKREVNVGLSTGADGTQALVTFTEKK